MPEYKDAVHIHKFQFISPAGPCLHVGGCSNLPADSSESNVVSMFSMNKTTQNVVQTKNVKEYLPLVPFGDRVVDILHLQSCEGTCS